MSFSQLRKVPSRILNRMSSWGGRSDELNSSAPAGSAPEKNDGCSTNVVASGSGDSGGGGGGGGVGNWRKQRQRNRNCSESSSNRDQGGTAPLGVL